MIVLKKKTWLGLVFLPRRGTIAEQIVPRFAVAVLLSLVVTGAYEVYRVEGLSLTTTPFTIVGFVLAIFLGFRNNASYDRFWEGRKLWGRLVNTSRTFTRQVLNSIEVPEGRSDGAEAVRQLQVRLIHRQAAYVHALRLHLRSADGWKELSPLLPEGELDRLEPEMNKPIALLQWAGDDLADARSRGWVGPYHHVALEQQLTDLTDIQGGCERIKNTPIPLSHTALTHRLVGAYVWALPFGLVETVEWLTPLVVTLVAYSFFALDALGEQLEDPFGLDCDDLPLDQLSRMIEINLRQRLGETKLPAPVQPNHNDVLT